MTDDQPRFRGDWRKHYASLAEYVTYISETAHPWIPGAETPLIKEIAETLQASAGTTHFRKELYDGSISVCAGCINSEGNEVAWDQAKHCTCTPHWQDAGGGHTEYVPEYDPFCPEHSVHVWDPRHGEFALRGDVKKIEMKIEGSHDR